MDDRSLAALTGAILVLLQLQLVFLPDTRADAATRTAELRRLGIDLAAAGAIAIHPVR
jgi:hypothetical protein